MLLVPSRRVSSCRCRKTEQSHSEQLTDTSSLNMFFDDELFAAAVLGGNFFRVSGMSTTYAPPPLCRDDHIDTHFNVSTTPKPFELTNLSTLVDPVSTSATAFAAQIAAALFPSTCKAPADSKVLHFSWGIAAVACVVATLTAVGLVGRATRRARTRQVQSSEGIEARVVDGSISDCCYRLLA